MQLSQVLTLAFATTVLAKVYNDNTPIPDSVVGSPEAEDATITADEFAVGAPSARLHRKDDIGILSSKIRVCKHGDFGTPCLTISNISDGLCYNVPGNWNDIISSTDTYGSTCTVFEHGGCKGDQSTVNGRVNWGHMNDKISSYKCWD